MLVSTIVTSGVGVALAGLGVFSLGNVLLANLLVSAVGLGWGLLPRGEDPPATAPNRDRIGPAIALVALVAYWPAYPTFWGAADSTAYVATGISLAHHGTFSRQDDLGRQVPLPLRGTLFDSMSGAFFSGGPPYRRMPGAMLLESLDSTTVWPSFFPTPSVWAALFTAAAPPWSESPEEFAPAFAPVFTALTLWAFWLLARCWMTNGFALLAVALLAGSGPFLMAARFPLSEPIAAFFALSGLAALASARPGGGQREATLAGLALGAALFVRVEFALLLAMALALLPTLETLAASQQREPRFWRALFIPLLGALTLTALQIRFLPGAYAAPLADHLRNAHLAFVFRFGMAAPFLTIAIPAVGALFLGLCSRRFGVSATLRWGLVGGVLVGHAAAASFLVERTPMWLSFYLGWWGLFLAVVGSVFVWQSRDRLAAAPLVLALLVATSLVLFYNPHVYPTLPWGARRFVPVLLPLLILMSTYACAHLASRQRALGSVCVILLILCVGAGGRSYWGKPLWEGSWAQLQALSDTIPAEGALLIDREMDILMAGPALWLIFDRNSLPVPSLQHRGGREVFRNLVGALATREKPAYFLTRGNGTPPRLANVKMERVAKSVANLRMPASAYSQRPEAALRYLQPLALYRVTPTLDPLGTVTP